MTRTMTTAAAPRLFAATGPPPARRRPPGTRLPAVYHGPPACPRCGAGTMVTLPAYVTVPLFAMYGHGHAHRITPTACSACGHAAVMNDEAIRPPR